MFKNIFSSGQTIVGKESIGYEMDDFCFESALIDIQCVMEDTFFDINKDHITAVYTGLKYQDADILKEGVSDFKNSVIEYFKKLIQKIKEFMKKVFMFINAFIGDFEKFLKRYEKELMQKKPEFQIQGFEYTTNEHQPDISIIQEMVDEYNGELSAIENMAKKDVLDKRKEKMKQANLDELRRKVIGDRSPINKDDFTEACKKIYRNGDGEKISIEVNQQVLQETISNFSSLKKLYNDTKKEKDRLLVLLENIKKFFERSASFQYLDGKQMIKSHTISTNNHTGSVSKTGERSETYSVSRMEVYNAFFNFKFAYAKEVSTICNIAVTERVNALKEQLKQSKEIVRKSLTASTKEKEGE